MWSLEKWYRWTCLQGRKRDTDIENKRMDTKAGWGGGERWGMNWEIGIGIYTLICIKQITRASLVAQWLRIRLPMQGTRVQALVQEDPTCRRATKPMCHNYWACALEPMSHNYWACEPQLMRPRATITEACAPKAHALQQEKPPQWEARALQRRVAPTRRN